MGDHIRHGRIQLTALSDDLRSSMNLEALQEKWKALTKDQRQALAETKEQVKELLVAMDIESMQSGADQ